MRVADSFILVGVYSLWLVNVAWGTAALPEEDGSLRRRRFVPYIERLRHLVKREETDIHGITMDACRHLDEAEYESLLDDCVECNRKVYLNTDAQYLDNCRRNCFDNDIYPICFEARLPNAVRGGAEQQSKSTVSILISFCLFSILRHLLLM